MDGWMDGGDDQHNLVSIEEECDGIRTCRLIGFGLYMVGFLGTLGLLHVHVHLLRMATQGYVPRDHDCE